MAKARHRARTRDRYRGRTCDAGPHRIRRSLRLRSRRRRGESRIPPQHPRDRRPDLDRPTHLRHRRRRRRHGSNRPARAKRVRPPDSCPRGPRPALNRQLYGSRSSRTMSGTICERLASRSRAASSRAVALGVAWRRQELLRLRPVAALAVSFELGWIALHLALGVHSDFDSAVVYPRDGNALLHGTYPASEYPPGATLLFALEALVSGGSGEGVRTAHAFLMVPFEVATFVGIWMLRTRYSAWLATL